MKLTRQERKAAFDGTLKVLRRPKKPDQDAGAKLILGYSRGGKQFVSRDEQEREQLAEEGKPVTIDIPREPVLWITIKGWHLKQGSTEWETEVTIHDRREPTRTLRAAARGGKTDPGLRTRWAETVDVSGEVHKKRVPKRGEQTESHTPETERGYGAGGGSAIDHLTAVGDVFLEKLLYGEKPGREDGISHANTGLREKQRQREGKMRQEMRLAETRKRGMTRASAKIERQLEPVSSGPEEVAA